MPNVQAELALPILAGDQLLGVLNVHSDQLNSFTDIDLSNMTTLAAQIGTSIQNVRLYEQAQARARREQLLREITARVRGSTDPDVILRTAVREVGQALGIQTFLRIGTADELAKNPGEGSPESPAPPPAPSPETGQGKKAGHQSKKAEGEK